MKDNNMLLEDSMRILARTYHKILKVNLTTNEHIDIKTYDSEITVDKGYAAGIFEWMRDFAESGQVHPDDKKQYLMTTSPNNLREHFLHSEEPVRVRYRRLTDGSFRWVMMELIKASDYTDDNQTAMLYIRDIHDSYIQEQEERRLLETYCYQDSLTGLMNQMSYQEECKKCSEREDIQKIGVLYADLNCLKLVNDMQGHEKGNQYIIDFSNRLKEHFKEMLCYRLSGDEFLVVGLGFEREYFNSVASSFDDIIKSEPSPVAALGWCYEYSSKIEPVVLKAEHKMYIDKEKFHISHPELKRDVVERQYKSEMNFLIHTLTESYEVLLIADLINDTYRVLRHDPTSVRIDEPDEGTYSVRNDNFCNDYVASDYQEMRRSIGSISNLRAVLRNNKPLMCDYRLRNGQWRESTFWRMEAQDDGTPTKVMYYSQDVDPWMIHNQPGASGRDEEFRMTAGLLETYSSICLIDLKNERINLLENITLPDQVGDFMDNSPYDEAQKYFASHYLAEDQLDTFMKETNLLEIRKQLQDKKAVSYLYRMKPVLRNGDGYSYGKFTFCLSSTDSSTIILASKDITNIVQWTQNNFKSTKGRTPIITSTKAEEGENQ